jgi:ABC-type microcin C transport system duplicated ATPase subunit YejF
VGRIVLDGKEIQDASAAEMRRLRGKRIAMIFQEPMTALNPLSPVGKQIAEMFVLHDGRMGWSEANDRADRGAAAGAACPRRSAGSRTTRISSRAACANAS